MNTKEAKFKLINFNPIYAWELSLGRAKSSINRIWKGSVRDKIVHKR
jgi:hypothetical protein